MVTFAGPFLDSLLLGSLYTMMALGLTITYKVTRIPNFAHAELVTVGSYAGVVAVNAWGGGLAEALALAFAASAAVALAADELVFKPLFKRGANPLHVLVASIGVGLVIRYVLAILANVYNMLSVKSDLLADTLVSFGPGANLTTLHLWVPAAGARRSSRTRTSGRCSSARSEGASPYTLSGVPEELVFPAGKGVVNPGPSSLSRYCWAGFSVRARAFTSRPRPSNANAPRTGTSPSSPSTTRHGLLFAPYETPAHARLRGTWVPFASVNVRDSTGVNPSSTATERGTTGYVAPVSTTASISFDFPVSWRLNTRTRTLNNPMRTKKPRVWGNTFGWVPGKCRSDPTRTLSGQNGRGAKRNLAGDAGVHLVVNERPRGILHRDAGRPA